MKNKLIMITILAALILSVGIASAATASIASSSYAALSATTPSCSFEATSPTSGPEDLTVKFAGEAIGMTAPFSYHWDFGDGTGAEVTSVHVVSPTSHKYMNPGVYTVKLAVYDLGIPVTTWVSTERKGYITVTNQPPRVSIAPPTQTVHLGERAAFTSTVSGNGVTSYVWVFGDAHIIPPGGEAEHVIIPSAAITYETIGEYDVYLAVTNDGGTTISNSVHVSVIPPVPVADFHGNPTLGMAPMAVKFFDDTNPIMHVDSWTWDFGDATPVSHEQNPLHAYADVGLYTVTLSVNNGYNTDIETKVAYINVTAENPFVCPVCPEPTVCPTPVITPEPTPITVICPTPSDKVDIGVYRPASGIWYLDANGDHIMDKFFRFGSPGDITLTGDFNGDGAQDAGLYRPSVNRFFFDLKSDGERADASFHYGDPGDIPYAQDFNNDGRTDFGVWRPSTGYWYIDTNLDGHVDISFRYGSPGDIPVFGDWK